MIIMFSVSCSDRVSVERSQPLMGYWRTERNIIMSIYMSPAHGLAAVIKESPGFLSEETKPGTAIITQIKPLVDGGFSGLFLMPGKQKPVKVRLLLSQRNTLRIVTWNRMTDGNIMRWTRVDRSQ
ncbi:hypothetical protein ACFL6H_04330 [Candidatus Latescibacterota bacterium]